MNLETREIGVPTGNQDYLAALWGGLSAYHHRLDGVTRQPLPHAKALASRLVLAYTGQPRQSGFSNWDMFRRYIEKESTTKRRMETIAKPRARCTTRSCRGTSTRPGAFSARRAGCATASHRRWRHPLCARPMPPRGGRELWSESLRRGGGGCLVAFAREGRRDEVASAIAQTGASLLDFSVARRGVAVSGS